MTTSYRRRWTMADLGTPASSLNAHLKGIAFKREDGPTPTSKINSAAGKVMWASTEAALEAAIAALAGVVQEALDAGYMVEVTTNRDDLRPSSYKHCITLHVRKPGSEVANRVFINRMGRTRHDNIMPAIRQIFVGGASK
jgi:hypothetical protein